MGVSRPERGTRFPDPAHPRAPKRRVLHPASQSLAAKNVGIPTLASPEELPRIPALETQDLRTVGIWMAKSLAGGFAHDPPTHTP